MKIFLNHSTQIALYIFTLDNSGSFSGRLAVCCFILHVFVRLTTLTAADIAADIGRLIIVKRTARKLDGTALAYLKFG